MAEKMLSDIATAAGINFIIFRYFNVAGADLQIRAGQSTIGATHLIKVAAEVAAGKRSKIAVYGTNYATHDGSCVRDFIHVTDLVLAHLRAINFMRNSQAKFILNLGYGHGYSVLQVLDALHTLTSVPFDVEFQARRPGDVPYVVANSNRAVEKLDWQPKLDDLNAILKSALNWEIARNNANTANST
jgi:UDP-glucose 4-epimerase